MDQPYWTNCVAVRSQLPSSPAKTNCGWSANKCNNVIHHKLNLIDFRFHSDDKGNRPGFRIEYNALELSTTCGGSYSNASGILSSPSYPNPYPVLADCVYLISQPNGTYINISFLTLEIDCQGSTSDFIEMRDGNKEESPLIGQFCRNSSDLPDFITTTHNYLRIRWGRKQSNHSIYFANFFILRFMSNYFESGLGFQMRYESANVTQRSYNSGSTLGFTTQNGIITSPLYPSNYPDNTDRIYTISQSTGTVILLNFVFVDVENHSSCGYDYLEIRDGPSEASTILDTICGSQTPAPIQSSQNKLWMK